MNETINRPIDYWFFVMDNNQIKWAVMKVPPEMSLKEATDYIQHKIGKTVLNLGYGDEAPKGFRKLPQFHL
ncbi:hypothetical protein MHH81_20805 [Psychrobacillus sp. FSL H8-0484]|uniref:hypothetical protein n=1 Tax=Psychrobacillus sp. FSL H8-0484 TaxID=2921390 RepID=UPI0030F9822D